MICLHNIQNNHNIFVSQQVVNVINILDYMNSMQYLIYFFHKYMTRIKDIIIFDYKIT